MRRQFNAWVCGLAVAASGAVNSDVIYKYTDANGHVVYSDRLQAGAERIVIPTEPSDPSAVQARIADERAALEQAAAARRAKADADRIARAEKEKAARENKANCERAQSRVRTLANERMVYTFDAQGNRVYPSDKELSVQREAAKNEMEQYCE